MKHDGEIGIARHRARAIRRGHHDRSAAWNFIGIQKKQPAIHIP